MTIASLSLLDQAELLQLAINASAGGDSAAAISYLKEAVSRPDGDARAHYILGAEYAQIKMYDRAVGEMEAALALDPALSIARLQLGLLWLSGGAAERARDVLAGLDELPAGDCLNRFGRGLRHLIADEFVDARGCLADGIALNAGNPALNADMQKIVNAIDGLPAADTAAAGGQQTAGDDSGTRQFLLSAYTGKGNS